MKKQTGTMSKVRWISLAAAAVILISLPFWGGDYIVNIFTLILMYMAIGEMWNLLAGYAGLVSLGAQAFIGLGGYSLAGLFALWAAYQTDLFQGIAAVSPSVWFPEWEQYIRAHEIRAEYIYLSLGEKETKTRNQVMAKVGEMIELQHERLLESAVCRECVMEWNPGNHFVDSDKRTAIRQKRNKRDKRTQLGDFALSNTRAAAILASALFGFTYQCSSIAQNAEKQIFHHQCIYRHRHPPTRRRIPDRFPFG